MILRQSASRGVLNAKTGATLLRSFTLLNQLRPKKYEMWDLGEVKDRCPSNSTPTPSCYFWKRQMTLKFFSLYPQMDLKSDMQTRKQDMKYSEEDTSLHHSEVHSPPYLMLIPEPYRFLPWLSPNWLSEKRPESKFQRRLRALIGGYCNYYAIPAH